MGGRRGGFWSLILPARPFLITGLALVLIGFGGLVLGEQLQIHYISSFLSLGGAALAVGGLLFVLIGAIIALVMLLRGRR